MGKEDTLCLDVISMRSTGSHVGQQLKKDKSAGFGELAAVDYNT